MKKQENLGIDIEIDEITNSISLKKYKYIPEISMETISFEVKKKSDAISPYAIFKAISHSKFGSRSYFCFEWSEEDNFIDRTDYQRIEQESSIHGIGLIRFNFIDEQKENVKGEIILEAEQLNYDHAMLSSFIERFFPEDTKKRIIERTAHNLFW